jgi:hypothetical protein
VTAPERAPSQAHRGAIDPFWLVGLGVLVLIAISLASHAPAFDAGFIRFDDTAYVQGTPHVASGCDSRTSAGR